MDDGRHGRHRDSRADKGRSRVRLADRFAARLGGTRSRSYRLLVAEDALTLIARGGTYGGQFHCSRLTTGPGSCRTNYAKGAPYGADAWCEECIAFDALQRMQGREVTES